MLEDENGATYKFVLENDDAVSTLHALIDEARELVGRKDEDGQKTLHPIENAADQI
jgi:hypothetical protein